MAALKGHAQRPHFTTRARTSLSWQEEAACSDANANIFFDAERYADALLVCAPCTVKEECRANRCGAEGVWGGRVYQARKPRKHRAAS